MLKTTDFIGTHVSIVDATLCKMIGNEMKVSRRYLWYSVTLVLQNTLHDSFQYASQQAGPHSAEAASFSLLISSSKGFNSSSSYTL